MKWALGILVAAIFLSLITIFLYFIGGFSFIPGMFYEPFALNIYDPKQVETCAKFNKCSDCLDDTKHVGAHCGWCGTAQACIPRSNMYPLVPSWLIDIIALDPTKKCDLGDFTYSIGQCAEVCPTYKNCRDCAGALACGWSIKTNTCVNKKEEAKRREQAGTSQGSEYDLVTQSGSCPDPVCSAITDCFTCTNTTGCGYCRDTKKCINVDGNGSSQGGSGGSTGCAQGGIFTQSYQCPCSTITDCAGCAKVPGCGYCKSSKTCVNLDTNGLPRRNECSIENVATSAYQCLPGELNTVGKLKKKKDTGLLNSRAESSITDAEERSITSGNVISRDNTIPLTGKMPGNELNSPYYSGPRGAGDKPVSPAKPSPYVSGNGVLRLMGKQGSPLEDYVQLLVRSELAGQGVPMNYP